MISFPSPWTIANIPTPRGRIPGGFFKREGRPTEKEILTSRLIDRPVRPLFAEGFRDETQVIAMVLSADTENNPDVIGLVAGTAALYLSDIPFLAPVGAVRVGLVDGRLTTNPTYSEIKNSALNLVVAGTEDAIVMVEAGAKEVSEATIIEAIQYAHGEIRRIVAAQKELFELLGLKKREFTAPARDEALYEEVRGKIEECSPRGHGHFQVHQAGKPSQDCRTAQSAGGQLSRGRCGQAQAGGALC